MLYALNLYSDGCQLYLNKTGERHAWVTQLVECLTSAQIMISQLVGSSPAWGSVLTPWSLEPALDSVSPSFSDPLLLMLALSLSLALTLKINKH